MTFVHISRCRHFVFNFAITHPPFLHHVASQKRPGTGGGAGQFGGCQWEARNFYWIHKSIPSGPVPDDLLFLNDYYRRHGFCLALATILLANSWFGSRSRSSKFILHPHSSVIHCECWLVSSILLSLLQLNSELLLNASSSTQEEYSLPAVEWMGFLAFQSACWSK